MKLRDWDRWTQATWLLIAALVALVALTFTHYGVTVDEEHGRLNGDYFLRWYASGFSDNIINTEGNHYLYGSFVNAITSAASRISPFGPYETSHLLIAACGIAGIFFAWRTGKLLGGTVAGFLAAAFLALTPVYYGHMFMNPKDMPFAVLFLAAIYYLLVSYDQLPHLPVRHVLRLGIVIGLALGIRIGAIMLFGYCAVLVLLWLIARYRGREAYRAGEAARDTGHSVVSLLKIGAIAWLLMLVWWPYAQLSPILNPLRAFRRAANFTDFPATVLFKGRFHPADSLPLDYLPTSFLIGLPEFYAVALLSGVIALVLVHRSRVTESRQSAADHQSRFLFLCFATLFPLAVALVLRPILYDANRHFLFVVPPLAVLAGVAFASLLKSRAPRLVITAVSLGVAASVGATVVDMVKLHPYQYVYYNRTFGGLQAALGRYETDYWGQAHKEGMEWLIRNYNRGAPAKSIRVANTAAQFQTAYYIEQGGDAARRFVGVAKRENPHVVLSITRWNAHLKRPGRVLHVVKRDDVPLLYVVEMPGAGYQ